MKKHILSIFAAAAICILLASSASAYWIWTPGSKKFINPKNAVKDSPKEQFECAMDFYNAKDYPRAAGEFDKLVKQYEYSEYASKAQYHVGLCYENMGKYYIAFQNYQKAIENFPHLENIEEVIEKEFNIGELYLEKDSPRVMGADIMTSADRAVEIFRKIVENAPYGKLADKAQYKLGESYKRAESYEEALEAFQRVTDNYPTSDYADKARYEMAYCAYMASHKPAYASEPTDKAIKAFKDFAESSKDEELSKEADETIERLKDKAAEKMFITAEFYEKQKHYDSAVMYYQDIINKNPGTYFARRAEIRIKVMDLTKQPKDKKWGWWGGK